jgi:YggT family protein
MTVVGTLLIYVINVYILLVIVRALMSWFPLRSGTTAYRIYSWIYDVTEPYLQLFRRVLPPVRMGNAALDLSPIVGFVVLIIVRYIVTVVFFG